jgi:hypothetical protein
VDELDGYAVDFYEAAARLCEGDGDHRLLLGKALDDARRRAGEHGGHGCCRGGGCWDQSSEGQ